MFKLFCLKDRVFNSLVKREKKVKPTSIEVMVNTPVPVAMEIENGLKLLVYTDTEVSMDELTLSPMEFMSRFEKFKVNEISINEAENDIWFNAKDAFDLSPLVSLIKNSIKPFTTGSII